MTLRSLAGGRTHFVTPNVPSRPLPHHTHSPVIPDPIRDPVPFAPAHFPGAPTCSAHTGRGLPSRHARPSPLLLYSPAPLEGEGGSPQARRMRGALRGRILQQVIPDPTPAAPVPYRHSQKLFRKIPAFAPTPRVAFGVYSLPPPQKSALTSRQHSPPSRPN